MRTLRLFSLLALSILPWGMGHAGTACAASVQGVAAERAGGEGTGAGRAAIAVAAEAKSGRFLHEVIRASAAHEKSLRNLLRAARTLPSWVRNMVSSPRYVSGASKAVMVEGVPYELFAACLARYCDQSRLRILFSPDGRQAWLVVEDRDLGEVVLGDPPAAALPLLREPGL